MRITDSLCGLPDTNIKLLINYTPTKNFLKRLEKIKKRQQ